MAPEAAPDGLVGRVAADTLNPAASATVRDR
jgi:hypothetical protein